MLSFLFDFINLFKYFMHLATYGNFTLSLALSPSRSAGSILVFSMLLFPDLIVFVTSIGPARHRLVFGPAFQRGPERGPLTICQSSTL